MTRLGIGVLLLACGLHAQATPDPPAPGGEAAEVIVEKSHRPPSAAWYEEAVPDPAEIAAHPETYAAKLAEQGIVLDPAAKRVSVRAGVIHNAATLGYPIEYLVVTERGRTHEAAFMVRARPALLDACVRALGLLPGEGVTFAPVEPPPTAEQLEAGEPAFLVSPAHGPVVEIGVAWTGDDGARHEAPLESMLRDVRTDAPLPELGWIYTGSATGIVRQGKEEMERFMADVEGNVVAIYLDGRASSLFERNSLEGIDDTLYTLNPETIPPRGVEVSLVIQATEGRVEPVPARPPAQNR